MGQEKRTLLGRQVVWVEQWKCREVVKLKCSACEGDVQESLPGLNCGIVLDVYALDYSAFLL